MVICDCENFPEHLTPIPAFNCGETFGQIQKLAFQRLTYSQTVGQQTTIVRNSFKSLGTGANPIEEKTSWTSKMAASDGSKIIITPFVEAPTQEGGDAITFGGGNETLGGIEETVGRNASTITFALRKWPQTSIALLKKLQCEMNLGVYLFSEHGAIEAKKEVVSETIEGTPTDVTYYYPLPIRSLFVGDKVHGGLEEPDSNVLRFAFLPNYSDDLSIVAPNFNPLTELISA